MKEFELAHFLSIEDLIEYVKACVERNGYYDVYSKSGDDFLSSEVVFVDATVQVDDNDKEIYPPSVIAQGLRFAYSGEQFQDVVDLAIKQKPEVTSKEIIDSLNYYSENDDFLHLG